MDSLGKQSNTKASVAGKLIVGAAFLPLILYLFGINAYFIPDAYDNVIFFQGGKAIADSGHFLWLGKYVVDWGPGFSALLAIPFKLGFDSISDAKFFVWLFVLAGSIFAYRFLCREKRPYPAITIAIVLLLPVGLSQASRIMAEWPYIAFSFLFLHLLHRLPFSRRPWLMAIFVGLLLGYTSLIRFIGVLLGAAVVAQAWTRIRGEAKWQFKKALPELVVALVGTSVFFGWKLWVAIQAKAGMATESMYYTEGWIERIFSNPSPTLLGENISQLLFQWVAIEERFGVPWVVFSLGLVVVVGVMGIGVAELWRQRNLRPVDAYTMAVLILIMFIAERAFPRYLLPVAPLLVNYFVIGLRRGLELLRYVNLQRQVPAIFGAALTLWCLALGFVQVQAIVVGKSLHGGLSPWASPTGDSFYKGVWLNLYQGCQWINESDDHLGEVSTTAGMNRYVHGFTWRSVPDELNAEGNSAFLVEFDSDPLPPDVREAMKIAEERRFGELTVYKLYR